MNQELDIVKLIETNSITKLTSNYESIFINKIKEIFNENQQSIFVGSFYCYINYNSKTEFVINFDFVWKWLGFSRKEECKRVLTKYFTLDKDYKICTKEMYKEKPITKVIGLSLPTNNLLEEKAAPLTCGAALPTKNLGGAGLNKEQILMTINTFKKLCLKSNTKKADEIHDYFIKLEEVYHEILDEESNELRNQILQKDKQLIVDKQDILLHSYHKKSIVYLIKLIHNGRIFYKFGNTDNIKRRVNEHCREINQDIQLIFCIESKNNTLLEQKLKDYLKNYDYRKEEIINGKVQTELILIDDITIIQIKLKDLNNNLEDQSQLILQLKNEINQLKEELNRYRTGEIKTKVFSEDTYKHFINNNLQFNMKSKIELKVILDHLSVYINKNNIKFLQQHMFADNLQNFHGYNGICKEELITFIKELFPNAIYKDQGVKRHFVNISFKNSTTHYYTEVYQNFINQYINIGSEEKLKNKSYKFKVRTQTIINKFNNYTKENNIQSLFKMNKNDSLFSKELQLIICRLTNCIIKNVKYTGVDYQSFIGITLK